MTGHLRDFPNTRFFSLTRSSFLGQQRNSGVVWSGDITSNWDMLGRQVRAPMAPASPWGSLVSALTHVLPSRCVNQLTASLNYALSGTAWGPPWKRQGRGGYELATSNSADGVQGFLTGRKTLVRALLGQPGFPWSVCVVLGDSPPTARRARGFLSSGEPVQ